VGARVAEVKVAPGDLEPVTAAVNHVLERDPRAQIRQPAAGQDRQARPLALGEAGQRAAHGRRQGRGARRGDQGRQGAVVVEDRHEAGAVSELLVETVEEAHREPQDGRLPAVPTGILASSLSSIPAQR